jgi:hypothetical protein
MDFFLLRLEELLTDPSAESIDSPDLLFMDWTRFSKKFLKALVSSSG